VEGMQLFVDEGLGHSSYVVDLGHGAAAIIDPPRFATEHIAAVRSLGAQPRWTIDTHSHADYVTGSPALVTEHDASFIAPATSRPETPHHGIGDDESVVLAPDVSLRTIATPGHTPDHHAYLLERGGVPSALFTGGALMVGSVGRTDLCGPDLAEPLAHQMFHSLRRFDDLPDDLAVYPTHGAGSFCSAPSGTERTSTLGHERATNELFRITDEDCFVERLLNGLGSFPSYFTQLPELHRRGPRHIARLPSLEALPPDSVRRHLADGAVLVDVRPIAAFASGHVPGSISNTLRPVFASWLGWTVGLDRPIIIIADPDQDRSEIVRQCLDIGHDTIVGELDGGIDAWRHAGGTITGLPLVEPTEIVGTLLDVRQRNEYAAGRIPGAINGELGSLTTAPVPAGPITVMCGHGERAMTAASILTDLGHRDVAVLDGGPDTWSAATGQHLEQST